MKFLSRFRTCTLALLLLLVFAMTVLAADPYITFGLRSNPNSRVATGFQRYEGLRVIAPETAHNGISVLNDASILSKTGGGMMVSTAEPAPGINVRGLHLAYDPSQPDGRRFEAVIGNKVASLDLFDWEGKPLVEFVDSGHNGAINTDVGLGTEYITLDDAFQQRLLGLRFIQADLLPAGIIPSQTYLPRDQSGIILGEGERAWLGSTDSVRTAAASLRPLFELSRSNLRYVVLTDAGRHFVFSVVGNQLLIRGRPYYYAWSRGLDDGVLPNDQVNTLLIRSWEKFRQVNPLVIRAVERAFRTTSFLRFQQQNDPQNWRAFVRQVSAVRITDVPTPRKLQTPDRAAASN